MNAMRPVLTVGVATLMATFVALPVFAKTKVAPPPGDVAAGKAMFSNRCAMCHGETGEGGMMAPRLKGVYGAKAGSQPDFKYSTAITTARPQWTAANLDAFLTRPQGLVPGTRMMVATPKPEDRRNLIAYLATLRK